ncbi:unnamed protein product [Protopolystoma xenopodis]|uniref:Stabilizer of axonemal microtubules 2 n=1 Tax=Protopolystoma xenopodis TaxID=117903 RepID=A0A448WFP7_9PLAT|nr:unnamed protein product [Protopolystoma xenopodis]
MPKITRKTTIEYKSNTEPFVGLPTYQREFVAHRQEPVVSCKPKFEMLQSTAPLESETSYRTEYRAHPLEPKPAKQETTYARCQMPLDNLTTQKRDYTSKPYCEFMVV